MSVDGIACVVLAGAPADEETKARYNVRWRAEVPIAGKRMVDWVIEALVASPRIGQIVVVGDFETPFGRTVPPGESFLENVMRGIEAAEGAETLMVSSSDIPLATPEAFSHVAGEGLALGADLVYPVITREDCLARYPQLKRTFLRVKEGTFTGGNAILVRREFALGARSRIEGVYQARKKPLKLASMIGFSTLVRVLLAQKVWAGAVDIPSIEKAADRLMTGKLKALSCPWPEIGEDMDHVEDFQMAEEILASRV